MNTAPSSTSYEGPDNQYYEDDDQQQQQQPPRRRNRRRRTTKSCRLLPHGSYTLWIATCSTIGWCASLFQDGCDYAKVTGSIVSELASRPDVPYLEFGLGAYREPEPVGYSISQNGDGSQSISWGVNYSGQCTEYPFDLDGFWVISKAAAFLALVVGGGGTLFVWCSTCFVFSRGTWKWAGYELIVAAACQSLAFMWFFNTNACRRSEDEEGEDDDPSTCILFWGSKANVIAAICWFLSGLMVFLRYPEPIELEDEDDKDQEYDDRYDDAHHTMPPVHTGLEGDVFPPPVENSMVTTPKLDGDEPVYPNAEVL